MIIKPYENKQYVTMSVENPRNGKLYHLYIAHPIEAPSEEGYGILYALDGNAFFETAAEITALMTRKPKGYAPALVVGIGYPGGKPFDMDRRVYDFTMQSDVNKLPVRPTGEPWPANGGADEMLQMLEHTIMPMLAKKYHINVHKQALFGHSLGGLFTLYALFERPKLFTHYIASSASIWWNDYAIYDSYKQFLQQDCLTQDPQSTKLMLIVGAEELEHMVVDSQKLFERMQLEATTYCGVQYVKLEQEDHISVIPAAISRAAKWMLSTHR